MIKLDADYVTQILVNSPNGSTFSIFVLNGRLQSMQLTSPPQPYQSTCSDTFSQTVPPLCAG
jgi:hypothetical protein